MDDRPETIRDHRDLVVWREVMDIAALCARVGLLPQGETEALEARCATLGRRLVTFVRSLERGRAGA